MTNFKFSINRLLWLITLLTVIAAATLASRLNSQNKRLAAENSKIVIRDRIKGRVLEFLASHDPANEMHASTFKSVSTLTPYCDWFESEGVSVDQKYFIETNLVDVDIESPSGLEALLIYYDSDSRPGATSATILIFRDAKFLDCFTRSMAAIMGKLSLDFADATGDGRIDFEITIDDLLRHRYTIVDDKIVQIDLIPLKPDVLPDDPSQHSPLQ